MTLASIRSRLTILSFVSIALALAATTFVLNDRFARYFEDRIYAELEQHLEQLATNLTVDTDDIISVAPLLDLRFRQPFSGLYWQVVIENGEPLLSRSLWGKTISVPDGMAPGDRFESSAKSPTGSPVLSSGWVIVLGEGAAQRQVVLAVAIDESEVRQAAEGFRSFLLRWLGVMLVGLIIAAWFQIGVGLAPLELIHRQVEKVKRGEEKRLTGQFPAEVQPLVEEVNTLLETHDTSLLTARAKASDLAHGLKTPLTVMRALLRDIRGNIDYSTGDEIEAQISSMHRFIERELAQARKDWGARHQVAVEPVARQMVSSMKKLPGGADLLWKLDIPADLTIPFDAHDLGELFGNLLDNARKWASGVVEIKGDRLPGFAGRITICDDGPGIPDTMLETATARGESTSADITGAGLGLSISEDLMDSIGGEILLSRSPIGGLRVELTWPDRSP